MQMHPNRRCLIGVRVRERRMAGRSPKATKTASAPRPRRNASRQNAAVWRPRITSEPEFNPFRRAGSAVGGAFAERYADLLTSPIIRDACEDTAPPQGMRDLSDDDSLNDVVVGAKPRAKVAPNGVRRKVASHRSTSPSRGRTRHKGKGYVTLRGEPCQSHFEGKRCLRLSETC